MKELKYNLKERLLTKEREYLPPLAVSDKSAEKDSLGFDVYVEALLAFLTNEEATGPLTISIEGEWGSGKTSLMLQLRNRLTQENFKTVWFNPWRYDKDESLLAAFVLSFLKQVSPRLDLGKHWKLFWLRFNWVKGWPDAARATLAAVFLGIVLGAILAGFKIDNSWQLGAVSALFSLAVSLRKHFKTFFGNPLAINLNQYSKAPDYESKLNFVEGFHNDFPKIVEVYGEGKPIFVFLDDLDRCSIPKAGELIQAINLLVADTPNVFFIIGMDREKIAASIAVSNEKIIPLLERVSEFNQLRRVGETLPKPDGNDQAKLLSAMEFGYSYLEKFIQVAFNVPTVDPTDPRLLQRLLQQIAPSKTDGTPAGDKPPEPPKFQIPVELKEQLEVGSDEMKEIMGFVGPALDWNPRRIKQFVNVFRLQVLIALSTGRLNVDGVDATVPNIMQIAKIAAISIKWPLLLTHHDIYPHLFDDISERPDTYKTAQKVVDYWLSREQLLTLLNAGNGQHRVDSALASTLTIVFPRTTLVEFKLQETIASNDESNRIETSTRIDIKQSIQAKETNPHSQRVDRPLETSSSSADKEINPESNSQTRSSSQKAPAENQPREEQSESESAKESRKSSEERKKK